MEREGEGGRGREPPLPAGAARQRAAPRMAEVAAPRRTAHPPPCLRREAGSSTYFKKSIVRVYRQDWIRHYMDCICPY